MMDVSRHTFDKGYEPAEKVRGDEIIDYSPAMVFSSISSEFPFSLKKL
jgi:hypothetical protein